MYRIGGIPISQMGAGQRRDFPHRQLVGSPISFWPLLETSGTTAVNLGSLGSAAPATYYGVTLGQPGLDGRYCPYFDGATGHLITIHTDAFAGGFNGQVGSVSLLAKVGAGTVWTDGALHRCIRISVDGNNLVVIRKSTVDNTLDWFYVAGGVTRQRSKAGLTTTDWMHLAMTWSFPESRVRCYFNAVQEGADLVPGEWAGDLSSVLTALGANSSTGGDNWLGWLQDVGVYDRELTPQEVAALRPKASSPGIPGALYAYADLYATFDTANVYGESWDANAYADWITGINAL